MKWKRLNNVAERRMACISIRRIFLSWKGGDMVYCNCTDCILKRFKEACKIVCYVLGMSLLALGFFWVLFSLWFLLPVGQVGGR